MKRASTYLASVFVACLASPLPAASLYWDGNAGDPGAGATPTGVWNATNTLWSPDPTGVASSLEAWVAGSTAVFSAGTDALGPFTVTLTGTHIAGGIIIEEGFVELAGTGGIQLNAGEIFVQDGTTLSSDSSLRLVAPTSSGVKLHADGSTLRTSNAGNAGTFLDADIEIVLEDGGCTFTHITANILNIIQTGTKITGTGGFTKRGVGVLAVASTTGNNTYAGPTSVLEGELRMRNNPNPLPVTTDLIVEAPGIFNLNGISQQVGSLSGNGSVGTGNGTLTVGSATDATFSGTIANVANAGAGGVTTGSGKLTKVGSGTLLLTGANTYTGATTVNAGTLHVSDSISGSASLTVQQTGTLQLSGTATDRLANTAPITLRDSGRLLFSASLSESLGVLTLGNGSQTIDLGATQNVLLTFASSQAATWTGSLSIVNWNGTPDTGGGTEGVFFGAGGLTPAQVAAISFVNPAGLTGTFPAKLLPSGELVAQSVATPPFEQWQQTEFGAEASNSAIAGPDADPDADGLNNLLEYALAGTPKGQIASSLVVRSEVDGKRVLTFQRDSSHTDITIKIESSPNLAAPWHEEAISINGSAFDGAVPNLISETGSGTIKTVTFTQGTAIGALNRQYLRLSVVK